MTITVLGVKGNQLRIGIEAPRDVEVNREEIYQRILKERETQSPVRQSGVAAVGLRTAASGK